MTLIINLKIFLFAILFYFTRQIDIYAILMIFALLHEMGHLIFGIILGFKPKALKVMPLGVCVEFSIICNDYNKKIKKGNMLAIKKMIIAIAGPITNFIIICICIVLKKYVNILVYRKIVYANLLILIFNLLPIFPLDGGRILKAIIHILKGKEKAFEYVNFISNVTMITITMLSSVAIYYYKNIAILFIIIYLWGMRIMENKKYNIKKRIYKIIQNS